MTESTTLYCYVHPTRETALRCNNCGRPICAACAVRTPIGYRCRECVRGQQKVFDTATWFDYPVAILVVGILTFIGGLIVPRLGFFTIFLAPVAGVIIAEITRMLLRRRRSRRLFQLVAGVALVVGLAPILGMLLLGNMNSLFALLPLIWQGFYAFTVASTLLYRLGGIQIR